MDSAANYIWSRAPWWLVCFYGGIFGPVWIGQQDSFRSLFSALVLRADLDAASTYINYFYVYFMKFWLYTIVAAELRKITLDMRLLYNQLTMISEKPFF